MPENAYSKRKHFKMMVFFWDNYSEDWHETRNCWIKEPVIWYLHWIHVMWKAGIHTVLGYSEFIGPGYCTSVNVYILYSHYVHDYIVYVNTSNVGSFSNVQHIYTNHNTCVIAYCQLPIENYKLLTFIFYIHTTNDLIYSNWDHGSV